MNNPYTLTFGKQPTQFIARTAQTQQVVDTFLETPSTQQVYMITGVRGSGKTVFMTDIASEIAKYDDWIIVELNPQADLLHSLAATCYDKSWHFPSYSTQYPEKQSMAKIIGFL